MWDDDEFKLADPESQPGEGYLAAVVLGALALMVSMYIQSF